MNEPAASAWDRLCLRQRWQSPWQLAYLACSNEKCVPVCQLVAVKRSFFHIYGGLVSYNTSYKIGRGKKSNTLLPDRLAQGTLVVFYYSIPSQDWFNFQVLCGICFSESERVKGDRMPHGLWIANSAKGRLCRVCTSLTITTDQAERNGETHVVYLLA